MPHVRKLRLPLTLLIILNLVIIRVQLLLYPRLIEMQGVIFFIAEPIVILTAYGIVFYWLTNNNVQQDEILWGAIPFGLFSGVLEISHISIEVFGHLTPRSETISTGLFLCVVFIPWGVAGYWLTRKRGKMTGLLTGSFSAMLCMLLVVT